jgi:hypothetical protein
MVMQLQDPDLDARRFIDDILEINRRFGMDGDVSAETYDEAVAEAAEAFSALQGRER